MTPKLSRALSASLLALTFSVATQAAEPIWDANKVQMRSQRLAPGVYAHLPADAAEINAKGGAAATSGGLIVGKRGAMLIETMLNRRLHDQVRALARQEAAGVPLLYAVNTSSHGDHSFGNMNESAPFDYRPDLAAQVQPLLQRMLDAVLQARAQGA